VKFSNERKLENVILERYRLMKIVKVFYVTCRKFAKYVLVDEGEARDKMHTHQFI
jgi:hypothetical protein